MNQININQGNMWNQQGQNGPTQPQQMNQSQVFIQQQQQQQQQNMQPSQNIQQQNMPHMGGQSTGYLSHHDYALPANQAPTQRLSHFPEPQRSPVGPGQPNQSFNMQSMSSPPGTNRLSHMPVNSMNNNINRISGQMTATTQSFPSSSQGVSLLGNTNMGQTQPLRHPNFPSDMNMQQAQINSGQQQMNGSQIQHFQFPNQQQNQQPMSQAVGETSPLTHFPNTSPTENTQFHPQYPGMQQQTHSAASPRPTPPPPSLTPTMPTECLTHPPTQTQENFPQTSLQQLEQMMPQNNMNNASSTQSHVLQVSGASQTLNVIKCVPNPSGGQNFQNVQVSYSPAIPASVQKIAITTVAPSVNTSIASRVAVPAQASPNTTVIQNQQMQQMNVEIQQLQQQIQQLYNMQQTPQTQQKMLDLQERMRSLKAQQQQQLLRERQMQQQQQQLIQQPLSQQQQKPQQMKQIILTIQNPQQKKQIVANVQNRPVTATSVPQAIVQRIQLRPLAPQNVTIQQQPEQLPTQTVQSLLQPKLQIQTSQAQKPQPQIIIQQKPPVQPSQQLSTPILVTQFAPGDSKPRQVKVVTLTPQNTLKTVQTIITTPVSTPEKTSVSQFSVPYDSF
jgi:hypothetical protein